MNNFFQDFKDNLIKQYFECQAYKFLCDSQGFNPSINLNSEADIEKVPFIATTLFKKSAEMFTNLLRVPLDVIDKWTLSSSTSGDPSMVGRRKCDIMKIKELDDLNKKTYKSFSNQACVFFPEPKVMREYKSKVVYGKSTESYIGNILDVSDLKDNSIFLVKPDEDNLIVDMDKFKLFLETHNGLENNISICGSTPLLFDAINILQKTMKPLNLGKNALVNTFGGGWDGKKGTVSIGTSIKRQDFVENLSNFLGIPEDNFIDSYSFTENTFSITGHYSKEYKDYLFHVPEWGRMIIRDIKTLKPLYSPGDRGFIQMLNAYGTTTFAGASVLVDDIGEIVSISECPECKTKLMTIKIIGRVRGAEAKGCGATLNVRSEK
ncbi:acyl-protein synthetase, LuxE [Clostridium puniceum]|uniref:Acyl-protein synthetase, LuxE n=1 Tax=Clostridium puniceum TaxID=29367 RepID=A0A1S8TF74_9CLOT|nr:acyl-protein synthetase [Clostridium puniceum]OOM76269.1 acyl-protein synthetase, LuxE [Clostridium puniceum]